MARGSGGAEAWEEVAGRVFVRRHRSLDVSCGLVVGEGAALLVDTRCHDAEARELLVSLRRITALPVIVVNTHAHFDHCFGNRVFLPAPIWGQERCAEDLLRTGEVQRASMMQAYPEMRDALAAVQIVPPSHLVSDSASIDLGGRVVELLHPGRGHTDHDLCVLVPDVACMFAGDLLEESGPPAYEDAWPLEWPGAVARLLASRASLFVPGHGRPMSRSAAASQGEALSAMASLCSAVAGGEMAVADAVPQAPFPPRTARIAISRVAG